MSSHLRADVPTPLWHAWSKLKNGAVHTDWAAYATAYDLLTHHNPAYQALLHDFEAFLGAIEAPDLIYDIGGGTGNYTEIVARACPRSEIRFVEPDMGMLGLARAKLSGRENISFYNSGLEAVEGQDVADLIICVHALYAMPDQGQRLADLRRLLRPGGWLFLVDLGRHMNVADWRRYLFTHLKKEHGLIGALKIFWAGRQIAKQNKTILRAQKKGIYWTHTEAEIASAASAAGLEIVRQKSVYRGYSDLLVCRAMQ